VALRRALRFRSVARYGARRAPRYNRSMKVVCAPDKFKGSLSADEIAAAMAAGACQAVPGCTAVRLPLADGGDGTLDALVAARGGRRVVVPSHDPLGRQIEADIGDLGAGTFVIEMARASGLALLRPEERDPFQTGTYGTGELICAALDLGATEIILGAGGSATVDGGSGVLMALGARLLDEQGHAIEAGNLGLAGIASIECSALRARLHGVSIRIANDVTNPLTGLNGAAAVFGPQKGARRADIQALDRNLARFAAVATRDTGIDIGSLPGTGAAGGLTAGLLLAGASLESGIELILDAVRFDEHLLGADLVLTGEGRIDSQSIQGKVVSGVLAHGSRQRIPVVALAGVLRSRELRPLYAAGLTAAVAVVDGPMTPAKAFARTGPLVQRMAESIVRVLAAGACSR
jgi:glycerate kinase